MDQVRLIANELFKFIKSEYCLAFSEKEQRDVITYVTNLFKTDAKKNSVAQHLNDETPNPPKPISEPKSGTVTKGGFCSYNFGQLEIPEDVIIKLK